MQVYTILEGERHVPGERLRIMTRDIIRIKEAVCRESIYGEMARQAVKVRQERGVEVTEDGREYTFKVEVRADGSRVAMMKDAELNKLIKK